MKPRVLALTFFLLFISCTVTNKNNTDKLSLVSNEKNIVYSESTKQNGLPTPTNSPNEKPANIFALNNRADKINNYASKNGYSTKYCFLIDMSIVSGRNRFFVYDLEEKLVVHSGLVAHGCCNEKFIPHPTFSNTSGSGCSSLGKYKIGRSYRGKWGKSYRLYGLDKSNSNAYRRAVVIHGNAFVEDQEIYPKALCNSFGCPMVSFRFLNKLSLIIEHSEKPILLWIYQ